MWFSGSPGGGAGLLGSQGRARGDMCARAPALSFTPITTVKAQLISQMEEAFLRHTSPGRIPGKGLEVIAILLSVPVVGHRTEP